MTERTHIVNGRFWHDLNGWTVGGSATYSAGNGDDHYGVASLPPGSSIAQAFAVGRARSYTLHVSAYGGTASISLTDSNGNSLPAQTASGSSGVWTESSITLGLAAGTTYTLTISNTGGSTILVDDVWLWWVPLTRSELAARVARKLSTLATDAGLDTTAAGTLTEGDYTDAVDAGLRATGAINDETDLPDVRWLDAGLLDTCLDAIERAMLERLQRYYATLTDIDVGPRSEKLSQIGVALARMTNTPPSGSRSVVTRRLNYRARDFDLG